MVRCSLVTLVLVATVLTGCYGVNYTILDAGRHFTIVICGCSQKANGWVAVTNVIKVIEGDLCACLEICIDGSADYWLFC